MKKILLLFIIGLTITSCKKEKVLEEVKLPNPELIDESISKFGNPASVKTSDGPFKMKGLKYQYDDLEPYIDAKTMETHYAKHHLGYANKLNTSIKETDLEEKTIEEILSKLDLKNQYLKNNAGGYYNHNLFFEILSPKLNTKPSGAFEKAILTDFGSFYELKSNLIEQSNSFFGSGWIWIVVDKKGKLFITQTTNQDNPLMPNATVKGTPIFAFDVWEHAYYLKYQNRKSDYIEAAFKVINWEVVSKKYEEALIPKE
ncbi:superoxide dismutase [Flavobacterium sp.]|uniref:superoxide dismutase n=1 Tax=Flavobacterium sp. TaxID=239 RepID=UPI003F6A1BED